MQADAPPTPHSPLTGPPPAGPAHVSLLHPGDLVASALMVVSGFIGLLMASRAQDIEIYVFGLSLLAFAALFLIGQVKRHYDRVDAAASRMRSVSHG